MRFIFEYSKNNKYEKDICNLFFSNSFNSINSIKLLSFDIIKYNFYKNIIEMYLNNDFIADENKKVLKEILIELKKNLK